MTFQRRRFIALLFLAASFAFSGGIFSSLRAAAEPPADSDPITDEYLRGYVQSWIRYHYLLTPEQIRVTVKNGVVVLKGTVETAHEKNAIVSMVATYPGVAKVEPQLEIAEKTLPRWKSWGRWTQPEEQRKYYFFPHGDLFTPPLADQKQPRFHTTWQRYTTSFGNFNIASVGFGENIGLIRRPYAREGDGVQFGVAGAVMAIFNLDSESTDLLNADYIIGFPFSARRGPWSARMRLYHLSSHLGDEFLLFKQPLPQTPRVNLSYETAEFLGSFDWRGFRVYGGPSYIVSSVAGIGRNRLQGGFEYRGKPTGWRRARFIFGGEASGWSETRWKRDLSAKTGLMFYNPFDEARGVQVLLEFYDGHAPHGQFYNLDVQYFGLSIAFGF